MTPSTVPDLLAQRVDADPGKAVMVCDASTLTYRVLDIDSRDVAGQLLAAGIGKGDRVALMMPNGIDWAVAAIAVLRIGAVLVPLSTLLRPPELFGQLRTGAINGLITVRSHRNRCYVDDLDDIVPGAMDLGTQVSTEVPSLRKVWIWNEDLWAGAGSGRESPAPPVVPADDMAILFTSGSSGSPKGTIHTHGNALRAVAASLAARCVRPGDRLYIPMPFFWAGGLAGGLLTSLVAGATLLTETAPEPDRTIEFLKRERVTLFRGWPQQGARIAARPSFDPADLPSLRPGSLDAVLPEGQRARPRARGNLFGMSETFGPYSGYPLDTDLPADKFGSCGKPFDGVDVRIVDSDTRRPVAAGASGEITLRGVTTMRGICGRERHDVFDADGYYATGDGGRLDEDGFLWYEGRLDDMFKVSGATVYPIEVETALRSINGVTHVFVTNVEAAGENAVGAVLVGGQLDLSSTASAARTKLSTFKVPTVWLILRSEAEIPRLASDKPDLRELQRRLTTEGARHRAS